MRVLLRCLAQGVAQIGLKRLPDMEPAGAYAAAVAAAAWESYQAVQGDAARRQDLAELAASGFDQVVPEAVLAARFAVTSRVGFEQLAALELFLATVPEAVRRAFRRPDDPSGASVPPGYTPASAADLIRLFPPRPPRLHPGGELPGRPGWVLDRLLGIGPAAEVWLVRQASDGVVIGAAKVYSGPAVREVRRAAGRVGRVAAFGRPANCVAVFDSALKGATPWVLSEYVPGGDSTEWAFGMATATPTERIREARSALSQVCTAVAHFHSQTPPLVHAGLKPSNVLIDRVDKCMRVCDFAAGPLFTRADRDRPRPPSVSPQLHAGATPTPRDDVYAIGVLAYQWLTGQPGVAPDPDPRPELLAAEVSEPLAEWVAGCLAEAPDRRPADAADLLVRLRRTRFADTPTAAVPLSPAASAVIKTSWVQTPAPRLVPTGFDGWLATATSGDAGAMMRVAEALLAGQGVAPDPAAAFHWYKRAADLGIGRAMVWVGKAYADGVGVAHNPAEAVRWFRRAADHGQSQGMVELGRAFATGRGVAEHPPTAVAWYKRAAAAGEPAAMTHLGRALATGYGVTMDSDEAARWYLKAAELGDLEGMTHLALAHLSGHGVAADPVEAVRWFRRAADLGHPPAMTKLGQAYAQGRGVGMNLQLAIGWYRRAARQGEPNAKVLLKRLRVTE